MHWQHCLYDAQKSLRDVGGTVVVHGEVRLELKIHVEVLRLGDIAIVPNCNLRVNGDSVLRSWLVFGL